MTDSALYFPYIEVPDAPSLTRVLLYWDRLGTIAPWAIPDLGAHTDGLVSYELVERVEPEEYVDDIDGFEDGFVALLDAARDRFVTVSSVQPVMPRSTDLEEPALLHSAKMPPGGYPSPPPDPSTLPLAAGRRRVHQDKVTWSLWRELKARGHVHEEHPTGGDGAWLAVDDWVASLYMAYLAVSLGRRLNAEPVTDQRSAVAAITGIEPTSAGPGIDRMRAVVLANVLPAPIAPIPPRELASFKAQHWDALKAFRVHVEQSLLDCAKESDADLRERSVGLAADSLEQEVVELEARMTEAKLPSARGVLAAVLAGGASAAVSGPLTVRTAAAPVVYEVVNSLLGRDTAPASSPVAYAALARNTLTDSMRY